jgi:superfamily I DNA and/or RNA helicase
MIKSHKLSIILTAAQTMSISALKEEVLSALQSHPDELLDIPEVKTVKDFELSRELKEKGKPTGNYDVLRSSEKVKDNLVNWDTIYIQFLNDSGTLILLHSLAEDGFIRTMQGN